jgi:hypothetical protein
MQKIIQSHRSLLFLLFLLLVSAQPEKQAAAQTPQRQTTVTVAYTEYQWWLLSWETNEILCYLLVDHEGIPRPEEVTKFCGTDLSAQWQNTPPCEGLSSGDGSPSNCEGLYLFLVSSQPKEREVIIDLPEPVVWVTLESCTPSPPGSLCQTLPALLLTGEEPLPNERITAIHGTFNGIPFTCESSSCALPLQVTPFEGVPVEFWAESSYGDFSQKFTALVRVIETGVTTAPGGNGWYVDVLSTQWLGGQVAGCAQTWQAFPPVGGLVSWLSTPEQPGLMASGEAYFYLAGRLIAQGVVDASACPAGGLLPNGYADACGLDLARPLVETWQNQFDSRILNAARESGVPAQLMKNLFAQESQFWPGVFRVPYEFGLGQITDKGADTILMWNDEFFNQFCPLVLSADACNGGYLKLKPNDQAILRGAMALQAKADCPTCPAGIDLSNVDFSMTLFANTLRANCEQVGQVVFNATEQVPGAVASYEDLWRFTIANYHAGPGCVSYAVHMAWNSSGVLNWEQVSSNFTEACRGVIPYVDNIAK